MLIYIPTATAGPAARIVPVYLAHLAAVLGCRMLELLHERAESKVGHLAAPQTVAFLKCESVVPDKTGLAQHRINLAVAL